MKNLKKFKKQSVSFIFIWLLVASFVLLFAKPLLAQTISAQFPQYYYNNHWGRKIVAWGDTYHYDMGCRSWNKVSVNLPSTGDYKIVVRYYADGTAEQTHEEFKILIDGNYIGRTTDCGTGCYENENLGIHQLGAGTHTVKASHLWTLTDWNSPNSASPLSISFTLITPPPTVDIKANNSDGPITIDYNTSATLSWTSTNATSCQASGNWSGSKATSGSENTGNLISSKTYTITCTGPGGSATDSVTVNVSSQPTLYVTLEAIPNSGYAPLNDVDLRATVSGSATGSINYKFDCTNDGIWDHIFNNIWDNPKTVVDACDYPYSGTYTAKVHVERGSANPASDTDIITVSYQAPPTVDIKANNSDGPITIDYNTSATLSWTSTNATSCSASGNWSGSKDTSGSENTGNLISSKTYTITCTGPGGSATDSVTVNVSSQSTLYVNLEAIPNSGDAPLRNVDLKATVSGTAGGEITYRFDCTNDGDWEQVFDSYSETEITEDLCNYSSAGTYTAKVRVYREGLSATDTDTIYVEEEQEETLYVDLDADPESGTEPLNNVDLTADVSGTALGKITYKFDCENDGDWDYIGDSYSEIKTVASLCDYEKDGTYTAKVKVYRDGLTATDTDTIRVYKVEEKVSLSIDKKVRNQTRGQTSWYSTISASPSDKIAFRIKVTSTGDDTAEDVIIKDTLPEKFAWQGNLKVDGKDFDGDISDGIEIGNLSPGRSKTITFEALIASKEEFVYGTTDLINAALVYNVDTSVTDTAKVRVTKTAVAGAVTEVPTGILSSAKVSLFITILIILLATYLLLLKSYFSHKISSLEFNEIVFDAKEKVKNFFLGIYQSPKERSEKRLSRLIADVRTREGLE